MTTEHDEALETKSVSRTRHFDCGASPRAKICIRVETRCGYCARRLIVYRQVGEFRSVYYCNPTHNRKAGYVRAGGPKRRRGEPSSSVRTRTARST